MLAALGERASEGVFVRKRREGEATGAPELLPLGSATSSLVTLANHRLFGLCVPSHCPCAVDSDIGGATALASDAATISALPFRTNRRFFGLDVSPHCVGVVTLALWRLTDGESPNDGVLLRKRRRGGDAPASPTPSNSTTP